MTIHGYKVHLKVWKIYHCSRCLWVNQMSPPGSKRADRIKSKTCCAYQTNYSAKETNKVYYATSIMTETIINPLKISKYLWN